MKILIVHNFYQQPGGEDDCFRDEASLLEDRGHTVIRYTQHNDAFASMNPLRAAQVTFWNRRVRSELRALIRRERPDVAHFHNTFPLISPAAYYAARAEGLPVVQTLHNYRLLCPSAVFFREGQVCELCARRQLKWPGVRYACYRQSRLATAVVALMLWLHHYAGTWQRAVDRYIVLTEFARQKFVANGLPAGKIAIKPNFVHPAPAAGDGSGGYALFIGRLSPEKGIETMLEAWQAHSPGLPLKLIGDGPLRERVQQATAQHPAITWLGRQPKEQVYSWLQHATCLVFPSLCYEGMPRVIIEAFATGTPVIASNLGAAAEMIQDGETGLHFRAGDAHDLAVKAAQVFEQPGDRRQMGKAARAEFEANYTAERNYEQLMAIYEPLV